MIRADSTVDMFERARSIAATGLFIAGLCAVVGSLLDWVTITPPPVVPADQADRAVPFNGLEAGDGRIVLVAGIVMCLCAVWIVLAKRGGPGILAMLAAMVTGAIAFADYRATTDDQSALIRRMEPIGDVDPGIGLTLVGVAAVLGLITAVAGIAASPHKIEQP